MTKLEDIKCRKCGRNAMESSRLGHYLKRVNKKGKGIACINECYPDCEEKTGGQDEALLNAIKS